MPRRRSSMRTPGRRWHPARRPRPGRDVVLQSATRRVPVVDGDGRLVGVLAMTKDLQHFSCRAPVR